jgi:hypothetical protein
MFIITDRFTNLGKADKIFNISELKKKNRLAIDELEQRDRAQTESDLRNLLLCCKDSYKLP